MLTMYMKLDIPHHLAKSPCQHLLEAKKSILEMYFFPYKATKDFRN